MDDYDAFDQILEDIFMPQEQEKNNLVSKQQNNSRTRW